MSETGELGSDSKISHKEGGVKIKGSLECHTVQVLNPDWYFPVSKKVESI